MSASAARALSQPSPQAPSRAPQRNLRPVAKSERGRKPKFAYALLAVLGAMSIGAIQIGLSLAITQDSFVLAELRTQQREQTLQAHSLQEQLTGLSSPQALAGAAADLGMVVAGSASYLRLSDGAVVGAGTGAERGSSVDPHGAGAVANALLSAPPAPAAPAAPDAAESADGVATPQVNPNLPPPITEGLPSPTTR